MAKKTSKKDIQMYSGHVRLYAGPNNSQAIEDMVVENFPASSLGNAHAFLVQVARDWLDDNGHQDRGGMKILRCSLEGQEAEPQTGTTNALAIVERNNVRKERRKNKDKLPTFAPYKCPIVALCTTRFVGTFNKDVGIITVKQEEAKP
jgi:hypothetical protein